MVKGRRVSVIGLWHLGTVTAACLASFGHSVVGIDANPETISNLKKGIPPIYEPGLAELVAQKQKDGALSFTTDLKVGIANSEYVIIALDTPLKEDNSPDLKPIIDLITDSVRYLKDGCLLVISSQVPVGTSEEIRSLIQGRRPSLRFGIACIPENLQLGNAIARFKLPDLLVIGADKKEDSEMAEQLYWFVESNKVVVDLRTAEMIKHSINSFLACEMSYGNEIGNLCDELGVDEFRVAEALRLEPRIGKNAQIRSGLGFSGGTIARDLAVLREIGRKTGVKTSLLDAVVRVNEDQNHLVIKRLEEIFGRIKGLHVAALGLTYKPGTSTIRNSVPLQIVRELVGKGASVKAYDPKAVFNMSDIGFNLDRCGSAASAIKSSDAILVLTGWPEFKELDFAKLKPEMASPVVIDATNTLDGKKMSGMGFSYLGIGRGKSARNEKQKGLKQRKGK